MGDAKANEAILCDLLVGFHGEGPEDFNNARRVLDAALARARQEALLEAATYIEEMKLANSPGPLMDAGWSFATEKGAERLRALAARRGDEA